MIYSVINNSNKAIFIFQSLLGINPNEFTDIEKQREYVKEAHEKYIFFRQLQNVQGFDLHFVKDEYNDLYGWYIKDKTEYVYPQIIKEIKEIIKKYDYDYSIAIGSSKGGFGALFVGNQIEEINEVIAIVPQIRVKDFLTKSNTSVSQKMNLLFTDEDNELIYKYPIKKRLITIYSSTSETEWPNTLEYFNHVAQNEPATQLDLYFLDQDIHHDDLAKNVINNDLMGLINKENLPQLNKLSTTDVVEKEKVTECDFAYDLFGPCIIRDMFSITDQNKYVNSYVQTVKLASLLTEDLEIPADEIKLESMFQKRSVLINNEKSKIYEMFGSDNLIINLADERFRLIKVLDVGEITLSNYLQNSKFLEHRNFEAIEETDDYINDIVAKIWYKFGNLIDNKTTILVETSYAFLIETTPIEKFENRNQYLTYLKVCKYEEAFKKYFKNISIIPKNYNLLINQNHKWGITPYHYTDETYFELINQTKTIASQNYNPQFAADIIKSPDTVTYFISDKHILKNFSKVNNLNKFTHLRYNYISIHKPEDGWSSYIIYGGEKVAIKTTPNKISYSHKLLPLFSSKKCGKINLNIVENVQYSALITQISESKVTSVELNGFNEIEYAGNCLIQIIGREADQIAYYTQIIT
ncbi:MAG: DUF6270 domain-containing protein [Mycoplasmatales bacterium]